MTGVIVAMRRSRRRRCSCRGRRGGAPPLLLPVGRERSRAATSSMAFRATTSKVQGTPWAFRPSAMPCSSWLVFRSMRGQRTVPGGPPKKLPVALGISGCRRNLHHVESIGNFRRQQITVLIADVGRRAFQVYVDPLAAFKPIGGLQTRSIALTERLLGGCERSCRPPARRPPARTRLSSCGISPFPVPQSSRSYPTDRSLSGCAARLNGTLPLRWLRYHPVPRGNHAKKLAAGGASMLPFSLARTVVERSLHRCPGACPCRMSVRSANTTQQRGAMQPGDSRCRRLAQLRRHRDARHRARGPSRWGCLLLASGRLSRDLHDR